MISTSNVIFLDWDECLCSSLYATNEKHADELMEKYGEYWQGVKFQLPNDGWYVSFIRSWSKELIKYFQMTLGLDNVCILSWGTCDYVLRSSNLLETGIPPNNTFAREDMAFNVPRFENKNCVLLDNESYSFHRSGYKNKVNFLYGLEPEKLIQVTNFDVRYFQEGLDMTIEELIEKIENAFEYKE